MSIAIDQAAAGAAAPAGAGAPQPGSRVSREGVIVEFSPASEAHAPFSAMQSAVAGGLTSFERARNEAETASRSVSGPATSLDAARQALMPGPAAIRPGGAEIAANEGGFDFAKALTSMARTFDYAVETQLIAKTGAQFTSSLNTLSRGQ